MEEIWKEIPEQKGRFEVSNLGKIKSKKFIRESKTGERNFMRETIMTPWVSYGYKKISFKGQNYFIHRLMAEAFIPNPNNLPFVNHIDFDRGNNSLENLEWVNRIDNALHFENASFKRKAKWMRRAKKWMVYRTIDGKRTAVAVGDTEQDALVAYSAFLSDLGALKYA